MSSASEIEKRFRNKPELFELKKHAAAKSDAWKYFSLLFEKQGARDSDSLTEVKYFCVCNGCKRVYAYKASDGSSFGTKNLLDHVKNCKHGTGTSRSQLKLSQCMKQNIDLSKEDIAVLKRKEVEYCIDGYHSFRSVEHKGLLNLLQTCADFGAKYGKFDVKDFAAKRQTVSRETVHLASVVKNNLKDALKEPIEDETVSLCIDLYTDDYRKKAYLDVHATWTDRDFSMQHSALAIRHFGTAAHTAGNISDAVNVILAEYGFPEDNTPVTTDHGSNVVAALRNTIRLDCLCHRLHTVMETAWRETKAAEDDAATYESAVSELCRYVKQATGIQEQLPTSLKHGGDTRPWIAMHRRADAVEASYETLVTVLTARGMCIGSYNVYQFSECSVNSCTNELLLSVIFLPNLKKY